MQEKPHQKSKKKVNRTEELLEIHTSNKGLINNCATYSYISTAKTCISIQYPGYLERERLKKKTKTKKLLFMNS